MSKSRMDPLKPRSSALPMISSRPPETLGERVEVSPKKEPSVDPADSVDSAYDEAVVDLARRISDSGLDVHALNREVSERLSRPGASHQDITDFLGGLPEEVRTGYERLHAVIARKQDLDLQADGMSREFFDQTHPGAMQIAPWMQDRISHLERVSHSPEVSRFVSEKSAAHEVTDQDLRDLARLCKRGKDCMEKAVYQWINANHSFSEEQFDYLRGV